MNYYECSIQYNFWIAWNVQYTPGTIFDCTITISCTKGSYLSASYMIRPAEMMMFPSLPSEGSFKDIYTHVYINTHFGLYLLLFPLQLTLVKFTELIILHDVFILLIFCFCFLSWGCVLIKFQNCSPVTKSRVLRITKFISNLARFTIDLLLIYLIYHNRQWYEFTIMTTINFNSLT